MRSIGKKEASLIKKVKKERVDSPSHIAVAGLWLSL